MKKIYHSLTLPRILLIVVVLVGAFFRLYNAPDRYGFDYDATRDALISIYSAQTFQFPLHGPPSAQGDFYFGPWYYYQLILFQLFLPLQYSAWISVTSVSLLGIVFMYLFGKTVGDWKLGIILALFTAISPSQIIAGSGLSNPDMVFTLTAGSLWILAKIVKEKVSMWWMFGLGALIGIAINYHFQALTLLCLIPFAIIYKKEQRIISIILLISGLVLLSLPYLYADVTSHWKSFSNFLFYLKDGKNQVYIPNSWTIYLRDFWPTFWSETIGVSSVIGIMLGVGTAIVYSLGLLQKKRNTMLILLGVIFSILFIHLRYYSGERLIYYLYYVQPFILFFVGYAIWFVLSQKKMKFIGYSILIVLSALILPRSLKTNLTNSSHTFYTQDVQLLKSQYPHDAFSVFDCGTREKNNSQAYAFLLYHQKLLSDTGKSIVFVDDTCNVDTKMVERKESRELMVVPDVDIHKKKIYVIDKVEGDMLIKSGWEKISPKSVYERELQ